MATLKSTFRLYDQYSRTADNVIRKTDQATNKILRASGATDNFNNKLETTGLSAGKAGSGLGKLITMALSYAAVLKGTSIADEYTNTSARLDLINDGLQTQLELQNKIFAAADRSKGSYANMASAVSKMGLLAGDQFSSNDELIAFTELIQKSFKVGGASTAEQSSAMLQLTQAMASGRLQGDEFRSIMENAPLIAEAIALYTGKSKGELKEMSAEGTITADIIKNAMFAMSDDINTKFEKIPMTFADVWNKIKNKATQAFGPFIKKVNEIINSDKFDRFIDGLGNGLIWLADVSGKALDGVIAIFDFVDRNWQDIVTAIEAITAAWLVYRAALLLVQIAQWAANFAAFCNPVGLAIIIVVALAAAFVLLWEKSERFRKAWVAGWKSSVWVGVTGYNLYAQALNNMAIGWNVIIDSIKNFVTALKTGMIAAVLITSQSIYGMINLFGSLINAIGLAVDAYNTVASISGMKTIDFDVNKDNMKKLLIDTTKIVAGGINDTFNGVEGTLDKLRVDKPLPLLDTNKVMQAADAFGNKLENFTVTGWLNSIFGDAKNALDSLLPDNDTYTVEGTGPNGAISVDMSDEDLKYLRDIAEREYINKFSTATLAPNVNFTFGDIKETADVDAIKKTLEYMMREEIAIAAEGAN